MSLICYSNLLAQTTVFELIPKECVFIKFKTKSNTEFKKKIKIKINAHGIH